MNKWILVGAIILGTQLANAGSAVYQVRIVNGGAMPLSPGIVYSSTNGQEQDKIGDEPSPGLVQLCQMGNPSLKRDELQKSSAVYQIKEVPGPILPGQSQTIEIEVPSFTNLNFIAMYGKSKDVCGSLSIEAKDLLVLKKHIQNEAKGRENVIITGAFTVPSLPSGGKNEAMQICSNALSGVDCLRALSSPKEKGHIGKFLGYLPSLESFIESSYGTQDMSQLVISPSGAVEISAQLKH